MIHFSKCIRFPYNTGKHRDRGKEKKPKDDSDYGEFESSLHADACSHSGKNRRDKILHDLNTIEINKHLSK